MIASTALSIYMRLRFVRSQKHCMKRRYVITSYSIHYTKLYEFDVEGEEGFRKREENVINDLTEQQGIVLATGGGSVLSKENRNRLSARGIVVYLETTIDKQLARTNRDKKRPLLQTDKPREVLESLADNRNPLYEEIADISYNFV